MFNPSIYQKNVFEWIVRGRGDGIVNAVAGAGKTTTLIEGAKLVRGNALFLAFGKEIVNTLTGKLLGTTMVAKTIHSLGYGICAANLKPRVDTKEHKYRKLATEWVEDWARTVQFSDDESLPKTDEAVATLFDLVGKVRLTLTDERNEAAVWAVADKFGITIHSSVLPGLAWCLREGRNDAKRYGVVDFTDMLWLPHVEGWSPRKLFDWVFVDECQDLSKAALELVIKHRAYGGRFLFVGDPSQAIMGFAGADEQSYNNIKARLDCHEMPLSICYRCPSGHLNIAREMVPQIEARPDAPLGRIDVLTEVQLPGMVREGDVILCRLTAPLIDLCIKLIANKVPARVKGRNIADQLTNMVESITQIRGFEVAKFADFVAIYLKREMQKLINRDASETAMASLQDRVLGMQTVLDAFDILEQVATGEELVKLFETEVNKLFADDRASIWLSTIHRWKGQESERVFILKPHKLPLNFAKMQAWEHQQEQNLRYVAVTRSTSELFWVQEVPGDMTGISFGLAPATAAQLLAA